jgi:hypothetical protein
MRARLGEMRAVVNVVSSWRAAQRGVYDVDSMPTVGGNRDCRFGI